MCATICWEKSLQIRSKLVKSVQNNLNFCHLQVVFQTLQKLCTLFRFKGTLDKKICSDLVYRYSCSSCNATYYGKTYRHFFTRAAEHMGISNLTGKRVKNVKESAVSDHLLNVIEQLILTILIFQTLTPMILDSLLIAYLRKRTSKIALEFLFVFFTSINHFMKTFIQVHNLLPGSDFGSLTSVCCEDSSMLCFSVFFLLTYFVQINAKWKSPVQLFVYVIGSR